MNNQNNCQNRREEITALVMGLLEPKAAEEIRRHIETCKNCKELYQAMIDEEKEVCSTFGEIANKSQILSKSISEKPNKAASINWRKIIRVPITKFAAAAVFIIVVTSGILHLSSETVTWADVIETFNNADNIHIITKVTRSDGQVFVENSWLKNKTLFRQDEIDEIMIDDGVNKLYLDIKKKTAQLSDSEVSFKNYIYDEELFKYILLFSNKIQPDSDTAEEMAEDYTVTELPDEHTDTERVFELEFRNLWTAKAIIDAKSNLPEHIIITPTEVYKQFQKKNNKEFALFQFAEVKYDYLPISFEIFRLDIPEDFQILSEAVSSEITQETTTDISSSDGNGNVLSELDPNIVNSLVLYYSFDSTENTKTVTDISGNEHHGQVFGAYYAEAGISGEAVSFDGENDYISVPQLYLDSFTFSAWVKTTTNDLNNRRIFLLDDGEIFCSIEGNSREGISANTINGFEISEYEKRLEKDKWTYITVTNGTHTINIYIDGLLTESRTTISLGGLMGNAYIGFSGKIGNERRHDGNEYWQGMIDEVALLNRALTAEEVAQLYLATRRWKRP